MNYYRNYNPGIGFVHFTLPIPGFASVVSFAVLRFAGDGVKCAPGVALRRVELSRFFLGKLLIGDELFH